MAEDSEVSASGVICEATRMIRLGAAAFVQTVPEGSSYYLYGPGFQVEINRSRRRLSGARCVKDTEGRGIYG